MKKWTITTETREEKIENINNMSDEEFENLINGKKEEIYKIARTTELKIKDLEFKLGETPYRKLTDEVITEEIIEGSDLIEFWVVITLVEAMIATFLIGVISPYYVLNLPEWLMLLPFIAFSIINYCISKVRHVKIENFAKESISNCKLFKSTYQKTYRRLDIFSRRNVWNYYMKFYNENDKLVRVKVNKAIYETCKDAEYSKNIYVVKMPIRKIIKKKKYIIFLSKEFENLSRIREQSKYSI